MSKKTLVFTLIAGVGALLGLVYSGFSTADFARHLDRELHPVNCTMLPGLSAASQLDKEAEGCKVAMFSPYSSFWREEYWGGIPWSLFAVGLFGFALALVVWSAASRKGHHVVPGGFLLLAALIAVASSVRFFSIAMSELHTLCKLCIGTYISSAILLIGALPAFIFGRLDRRAEAQADPEHGGPCWVTILVSLAVFGLEMLAATLLPAWAYTRALPDYSPYLGSCESLKQREDTNHVLLSTGAQSGATEALMVLDPLCPACKAFHSRVRESRFASQLSYKVLLMPLDAECNWMIKDSLHPGACWLSKAMLCAGDRAGEVLQFVYDHQEEMRLAGLQAQQAAGKKGPDFSSIKARVLARFPDLATCADSPDTKIKLNKALHWAVQNSLPILTPQLYLNGKRLCDEDTDLGLDYALKFLLENGHAPQAAPASPATPDKP
jgi:uncharacterized membrane protein